MVLWLGHIPDVEEGIHVGLLEGHAIWNLLLLCVLLLGICSIVLLSLRSQLPFEPLDSGRLFGRDLARVVKRFHELYLVVDPTVVELVLSLEEVVVPF